MLLALPPFGSARLQVAATATPRSMESVVSVEPGAGGIALVRPLDDKMQAEGESQFLVILSLDGAAWQMTLNRMLLPPGVTGSNHYA